MPETVDALLEQRAELSGIQFDIIAERRTSLVQRVTKHPVEDGAETSDFTVQQPVAITIRVEVGNLTLQEELPATEKAQRVYADLEKFWLNRTLFSYQTGFQIYQNLIIAVIAVIEEVTKSGGLIADLSLEQITVTEAEQVKIPASSVAAGKNQKQLSSEINAGKVEPIPVIEGVTL